MLANASDEVITELSIANTELENRAWSLFAILLSIGHPVPPIHLASRCTSFDASLEFVEFVCSMPDSPLSLTIDGLVTVSSGVCIGLKRFLWNSTLGLKILAPRGIKTGECWRKRASEDVEITYYRKRRRLCPNGATEKADQTDLAMPFRISNACGKVYIHVDDDTVRSVIMKASNQSVGISNDSRPDKVTVKMPSLINFNARPLNYGSKGKHEGEREMGTLLSMKEHGSKNNFLGNDSYIRFPSPSKTISGGDYFQYQSSSHLTASSIVRIEDIKGEKCSLSKKCSTSCQTDDNKKVLSLVNAWIDERSSRANNNSLERHRLVEGREGKYILDSASHRGYFEILSNNPVCGDKIPESNSGNRNNLSCNDMTPCSGSGEKAFCQEVGKQSKVTPRDNEKLKSTKEADIDDFKKEDKSICGSGELPCSQHGEGDAENLSLSKEMACKDDYKKKNSIRGKHTSLATELNLMTSTRELNSLERKHLPESYVELEVDPKDEKTYTVRTVSITTNKGIDIGAHIEQKDGREGKRSVFVKQKSKPTCDQKMHTLEKWERLKENKEKPTSIYVKDHSEPKVLPVFDSYIVEEEEGSGGYGTVYKARRKKDGTTFAIKYPHANANRHHVLNELKMLERFGGKQFVIKYEGSFKSGNSHCIVLQHFAHDRPEILKREIDVYQLQWYGYCLFRALASLHKQGVVHRDVKPGNFLYSCKAAKGYLIDFNLATDLHQKFGSTEKSKSYHAASFGLVPPSHLQPLPPNKSRKYTSSKALEAGAHSKSLLLHKNLKRKADQLKDHKDMNMQSVMKSQGEGKQRKEGPCVGTKGFRAPEVLFKSTHQGPKVDIWSAGVTLLYFIIGRTPFVGDPDQNIKEIAKLRGSEDLWEELFQIQSLPSTELHEWCKQNTRRPDFLEVIPRSLIDLVDKCLMVNPRSRISAEDALRHDFFLPCIRNLEKHRLLRQKLSLEKSEGLP
ncbi:Protein kinase, catalytic domain-containing protein [Cynara cardunculus var. scolymus]|uniref:non-specific serine/threonine protein kinase n=1 Tax=Cynara cardunculus var. scolymus TaxID=59895 RepID=A0A103XJR0_CYNCS|nr:Protein kinase, catalytic domain-containing protein [Cynara cardunculus var. scolymus]